jgi:RNA polymerase sigma factor (sigma-70 family)
MLPADIIERISSGDEQSFRQFYEFYNEMVYNTCLLHLQNEEEAEEAMQDTFVQVHQSAGAFKGNSSVKTWLYRIAVNKCLDRIRYKKRAKRFAFIASLTGKDGSSFIHEPGDFQHPGILAENREKAKHLFTALRQLPENQYTAFVLKQIEGLPQKEVAQIMNLSEKAVESLFQRAKAKLRDILSEFYRQSKE